MSLRTPLVAVAAAALVGAGIATVLLTRHDAELTVDDRLTVYGGFPGSLEPLANDHVAPGEKVCHVADPDMAGLSVEYYAATGVMAVDTETDLDPGRYAVDYTLCSGDAGEVTIEVVAAHEVTVDVVAPGVIEVTNPNDRRIAFHYGVGEVPDDGGFVMGPDAKRRFDVRTHFFLWEAMSLGREPSFSYYGIVKGIDLPPGVTPMPIPPGGGT